MKGQAVNSSGTRDLTWLALARMYRGLSQRELADLTGFEQAQISRLEAGERRPRAATLERLAEALDVPADKLFPKQGSWPMEVIAKHFGLGSERRRHARRRRAWQARR